MFNLLLNSENIFVKFSPFAKIARPKEKTAGCETLFTVRMNNKGQNSNIKFTQINPLRTAYIEGFIKHPTNWKTLHWVGNQFQSSTILQYNISSIKWPALSEEATLGHTNLGVVNPK